MGDWCTAYPGPAAATEHPAICVQWQLKVARAAVCSSMHFDQALCCATGAAASAATADQRRLAELRSRLQAHLQVRQKITAVDWSSALRRSTSPEAHATQVVTVVVV